MAAHNYISINPATARGGQVLAFRDALLTCFNLGAELTGAFAESVSDDGTYAALAALLGITGANADADAQAVHDLIGTANSGLLNTATPGSTYLQVRDRFNRNF